MVEKMSKWYRWDLHIHTPETHMNDGFVNNSELEQDINSIWKRYCQELNNYGADVLGITDYFSADNYFKLKKNRSEWGLNSNIVLFPNIEIRLNDLVSRKRADKGKETSYVNVHMIFNPDIREEELQRFLRELKVNGSDGRKLNFGDDIGEIVKNDKVNYMPTTSAMLYALRSVFGNNYSESVLVMIPNSDDGINLTDGNGSKNGKQFIQDVVNIIQGREKKGASDKEYLLSTNNNYGKVFPCVTGCDAHRIEQIQNFPKRSFTWIKANRTFEGLKQITYEPNLRVKIQENKPEPPVKSKVIKSLELGNNTFKNETLNFSYGLNTIIGGRSSGKSVLLSIISKLASNTEQFKSNNLKYDRLIDELSEQCVLTYADNSKSSGSGKIEFIYQDGLQEIARNDEKRNIFIENILSDLTNIDEIRNKNKNYCRQKHDDISQIVSQLRTLDQEIDDKEKKINSQQKSEILEQNIEKLAQDVKVLKDQSKDIKQDELDKVLERLHSLNQQNEGTTNNIKELKSLNHSDIVQLNPQTNQYMLQITKDIIAEFSKNIGFLNKNFHKQIDLLIAENERSKANIDKEIISLKNSEIYQQYDSQQENSPELKKFQHSLIKEQGLLEDVRSTTKDLEELQKARRKILKQLFSDFDFNEALINYDLYQTEDSTLKFKVVSSIDIDKFLNLISETFKTRSVAFKDKIESDDGIDVTNISTINLKSINNMMAKCLKLNPNLSGNENPYKSGCNMYTWFERFSNMEFIQIDYKITYNGQDFSDMSEGKQAFILLMMQLDLDNDDKPFLIDQPEDELDNKAIYDDLVSYLRKQKQHRQLFVVTHNANVLVGGDSECVTLAEEVNDKGAFKGHHFIYKQGTIENPEMQDSICEVLEGGQRAFKKREQRYAFSRTM